jgi:hypothetical protein
MKFERACYSVSKLNKCANMIRATNWTVSRKNEHFAKCWEINEIFQYAADNINRWLFDPEIELKEYRRAAFDYKEYTKKELDSMLRLEYRFICSELNDIKAAIVTGEVDSCD